MFELVFIELKSIQNMCFLWSYTTSTLQSSNQTESTHFSLRTQPQLGI